MIQPLWPQLAAYQIETSPSLSCIGPICFPEKSDICLSPGLLVLLLTKFRTNLRGHQQQKHMPNLHPCRALTCTHPLQCLSPALSKRLTRPSEDAHGHWGIICHPNQTAGGACRFTHCFPFLANVQQVWDSSPWTAAGFCAWRQDRPQGGVRALELLWDQAEAGAPAPRLPPPLPGSRSTSLGSYRKLDPWLRQH